MPRRQPAPPPDATEMTLAELRAHCGLTQVAVADAMEIEQSDLSKFERNSNQRLSTLVRFVEALGGELEVAVVIDGRRVRIAGVVPEGAPE